MGILVKSKVGRPSLLTTEQEADAVKYIREGYTYKSVAAYFNVSVSVIQRCVRQAK